MDKEEKKYYLVGTLGIVIIFVLIASFVFELFLSLTYQYGDSLTPFYITDMIMLTSIAIFFVLQNYMLYNKYFIRNNKRKEKH